MTGGPGRVVCLLAALLVCTTVRAQVEYRVVFDATWSSATHPNDFPSGAHFSPPIGGLHDGGVVFWEIGGLASSGIESMAETGSTSGLANEINAATTAGNASGEIIVGGGLGSPGSTSDDFLVEPTFDRVTLVSMIAPSPDWFVGVSGLDLLVSGRWRDNFAIDLYVYDAGTDGGATYTSPNQNTSPQDPIALIVTEPLATDGYAPFVGTFRFSILSVDGRSPYGDADGDSLTNLREYELGTNPTNPDTDGDTVGDAVDNCPSDSNVAQLDADADGHGDGCDNCALIPNVRQDDRDQDAEGDPCDLDDGRIWFTALMPGTQAWQQEVVYDSFNLYRGDLNVLRSSGIYTQDPTSPNAAQFCALASAAASDGYPPPPGEVVFYLVTGVSEGVEGTLGEDGEGGERPQSFACPAQGAR